MKLNIQRFTELVNNLKPNIANEFRYINYVKFVNEQNDIFFIKIAHNLYSCTDKSVYARVGICVFQTDDGSTIISDANKANFGIQNGYELLNHLVNGQVTKKTYQTIVKDAAKNNPYHLYINDNGDILLQTSSDQISIVNCINYILALRTLVFTALIKKHPEEES